MDAEEFTALLKNPALLENYSLEDLVELSEEYPFSQAIYPLIVKKAQLLNDSDYEIYLHRAAVHVVDRNRLFHFIRTEVLNGKEKHEEESVVIPITTIKQETLEPELPKTEVIKPEEIIEERITQVFPMEEETKPAVQKKKEKAKPRKKPAVKAKKAKPVAKEKSKPEIQKKPPEIKKPLAKPEPKISASDKHTFSEWLKLVKGEREAVSKFSGVEKAESDNSGKKKEGKGFLLSEEVFETGIRATRKIKTTPEEEEAMSRKAEESIKQTDENITETLAKVFEIQKKYDKAISAYEALILKYPDKNAYFARKIKTLKSKL